MGAAAEIQKELDRERQNGSIIFLPSAIVPESYYRPVIEKVQLTMDDIYVSQNKWRIRWEGLKNLAGKAGIEWSPYECRRTDSGNDKLYVCYQAVGLVRKADGKLYPVAASYDLDLELIKEELEDSYRKKAREENKNQDWIDYCVKRDWFHKRTHKLTLAESGAKARVVREILGLQSQYSNKDLLLNRPFVMVRFIIDHQNPDVKQVLLSAARDNMSAIYGGSLPQALPRFKSAASDDNVIDIPHTHPEEPANQPPETNSHPEPPFEPSKPQADSQIVDFENSGVETQVMTLETMARQKKYDLAGFLARGKIDSLAQLSETKRVDFFIYLKNL